MSASHGEFARLTALLDALPMAAALFDPRGMAVAVNRLGRTWFVVDPRAPLDSQTWRVMLHPLGEAAATGMPRALAGGEIHTAAVPMGRERLVDLRMAPFLEGLVLVSAADVSEREMRSVALDRARREVEALFDLSPCAIRVVDLAGRVLRSNAVAVAEFEAPQPATLRDLWERDAPHDVGLARPVGFLDAPGMRALAGGEVRGHLIEVRRGGEVRTIAAFALPLRGDDGRVVGALLFDRDATVQAHLEARMKTLEHERSVRTAQDSQVAEQIELLAEERSQTLLALQEERLRERRLSAVGQLAAGVMHDVNNALNPIMAAAYLLQLNAEKPDAVRDYAARIQKAAEAGASTASRVGRFIRQEPIHETENAEVDLSVLGHEVLDLTEPMRLQRTAEAREVQVVRSFGEGVVTRGLAGEVREALLNLVQNAIDAMPEGGTLTLRTFNEGGDACITVRDTGVGMSSEVRERAFEPFFTTKGAKGSGLGLAEVYGIARRHRGTAAISSVPGQGTEVTLRFPAVRGGTVIPVSVPAVQVRPLRMLVVEDHPDGREFLRRMLVGDGHTVDAVGSCAEARTRLTAPGGPPYDLMLTDVGLPDGNGWDLVREASRLSSGMRIGVLTGWEARLESEETEGVAFVLRKPLRADALKAHIAGVQ